MKKIIIFLITILSFQYIYAENLKVVTTYPYIASIVKIIGKDRVSIEVLASGDWDPHTIIPKPSFISKLRKADLLIINGAQLEIGWLPPLLNQANNPAVQTGTRGLLDLSRHIELMDVPINVSRASGDVHPDGNPHFYLDATNVISIANAITQKLSELTPLNISFYQKNNKEFVTEWHNKMKVWIDKLQVLKGAKVIEYHRIFDYFIRKNGLVVAGTIERLPGIPPTSKHIESLEKIMSVDTVKFILQDVYSPDDAAKMLSKKFNIKIVTLPHDVGAVKEAKDIFSLFDEIVRRLTND